ncbi:hypothetical protein [Campylobacter sp.]|uniref:hypothetical protein n=1 Tax=Campylobacter sp. TaxID=205 RepID=UPI002A765709|nr:hypothetical protein [Campylobacter sp.]MDY3246333.1 hypothetical protein [Campylobacter sp.]MDY4803750.1 hypothetical protein [Campylobacter sp.]
MKINLEQIFNELQAWREERKITAEGQKAGYIVNVMEKLGELAQALRDYKKFSKHDCLYCEIDKQKAEHEIIYTFCSISIFIVNTEFTINGGLINKISSFDTDKYEPSDFDDLHALLYYISQYPIKWEYIYFKEILELIAKILEVDYGFNFEIVMLETIKQISSNAGKEYKANYEKAKIVNVKNKK